MKKEKDLVGNTSGPTMEEFTFDKTMTVNPLPSELKNTLNISKRQWSILEFSVEILHLLNLFETPAMKY